MILDGLPLELMREVLLDLPTVDIIQAVKCTRRLYHFSKFDKTLGRRLQNRVFGLHLGLGKSRELWLYLKTLFRRANDAETRDNSNCLDFCLENGCQCHFIDDEMQKIEPGLLDHPSFLYDSHLLKGFENGIEFAVKDDSPDDAVISCGKLFNILTKFCIVRELKLDMYNSDYDLWDKMDAFFNVNPPDLRIQPRVSTDSRINLDIFLTSSITSNGLAGIEIYNIAKSILVDAYHEVLRRTPNVFFSGINLPYTYEDLFGFFKDTKELTLCSVTRITKQQLCQLVQNFYEVKHDERCMLEIKFGESFLVKDFLTLIPKEAYRLHLKRSGIVGPEPKWMIWAEMTDRFGGTWALIDIALYYEHRDTHSNTLRICSMKCLTEKKPIEFSDQSDCYQSDSDQSDSDQSDSNQSYSYESYSDQSDFD